MSRDGEILAVGGWEVHDGGGAASVGFDGAVHLAVTVCGMYIWGLMDGWMDGWTGIYIMVCGEVSTSIL